MSQRRGAKRHTITLDGVVVAWSHAFYCAGRFTLTLSVQDNKNGGPIVPMTKISLIKPLDQPPGTRRLLDDLKTCLGSTGFSDFRLIVAYAKSGPLLRLESLLRAWSAAGKSSAAILGIDQRGTSKEALELALSLFDEVYITQEPGITFHPKIYLFKCARAARAFIGSNNLTVGGTEKNFESAVDVVLTLPDDASVLSAIEAAWTELLPASCPATVKLDPAKLADLVSEGRVIDEKSMRASGNGSSDTAAVGKSSSAAPSGLIVKPESALPKPVAAKGAITKKTTASAPSTTPTPTPTATSPTPVRGLAIQIVPHHNGEVLLSVSAARQNPAFFGLPFTGSTKPKKATNKSYPQLDPDPINNYTVYGASTTPVLTLNAYPTNTVFYDKKKDIRITVSPLVSVVPDYSVMIMEPSSDPTIDYEITVHRPDSPSYNAWVSACNQSMPAGGGKAPRKFGWF